MSAAKDFKAAHAELRSRFDAESAALTEKGNTEHAAISQRYLSEQAALAARHKAGGLSVADYLRASDEGDCAYRGALDAHYQAHENAHAELSAAFDRDAEALDREEFEK